jgi:hypothetical protein
VQQQSQTKHSDFEPDAANPRSHREDISHFYNARGALLRAESFQHIKLLASTLADRQDADENVRDFGYEGTASTTLLRLDTRANFEPDAKPSNVSQVVTLPFDDVVEHTRPSKAEAARWHEQEDFDLDEQLLCVAETMVHGPDGHRPDANSSVHECFRGECLVVMAVGFEFEQCFEAVAKFLEEFR